MTSDNLYSIPTKRLLNNSVPLAEQAASNAVNNLGQRGGLANGFESDSNGLIYMAMPESNAINIYDPKTLQATTFVRDPRILWPDSMTVAENGYLYVNINQRTVSTFRSSSRGFN
jgi:sugar lactone lactonase YvrE